MKVKKEKNSRTKRNN